MDTVRMTLDSFTVADNSISIPEGVVMSSDPFNSVMTFAVKNVN